MSERLLHASAEECSQTRVRLVIAVGVLVVIGGLVILGRREATEGLVRAMAAVGLYLIGAAGWYVYVRRTPGQHPRRRYVTNATDVAVTTLAMHYVGSGAPFFYPVYLWIVMGNGLRFGRGSMLVSMAFSMAGFGLLLAINPFWVENRSIGAGLLAGLAILPTFYLAILRRLHQLNERLDEELVRSKAAERAKGDFLANMSHEIRTPMNGVLGMVQVLQDAPLGPDEREHVRLIGRSAEALLTIINDILDFSRATAGRLPLEETSFDLRQIMEDVHRLLRPTAQDKNVALHLAYSADAPRFLRGDPTRVRQVVFNLVGNAVKFTETGAVDVRCRVEPAAPGRLRVELEVADTGIGIPAERLDAIFEQFEQADRTTAHRYGGTGLGLAICRQLARAMDGDITVRSTPGEGSVFTAVLELAAGSAPAARPVAETPRYGLHALVVDDNKVNRYVAIRLLEKVGITADQAADGAAAVRMVDAGDYDLVLMDVRMPVLNGFAATARIRARNDAKGQLPILALTADAASEDAERCRAAGMDGHLHKPLRTDDLVAAVDALGIGQSSLEPVPID